MLAVAAIYLTTLETFAKLTVHPDMWIVVVAYCAFYALFQVAMLARMFLARRSESNSYSNEAEGGREDIQQCRDASTTISVPNIPQCANISRGAVFEECFLEVATLLACLS